MVAISLYKGNLRKATDAPRQWLMPTPQITVKDFRSLLRRREFALSRLPNPNPNPNPNTSGIENAIDNRTPNSVKKDDKEAGNAGDCSVKVELDAENKAEPDTVVEVKEEDKAVENVENAENPNSIQTIDIGVVEYSDPVRKKEVEEKLNALKEQKHSLVQVLKMIQNAEEELKKRNSTSRSNVTLQLQVEIPNDSGSITRLNTPTPRVRSDGNHGTTGAEVEGGVPDGLVNHNSDPRLLVRTSSASLSPSSDSQHKKPAHNSVPLPGRTLGGVSASPSRFAPNAPQGHTSSLPTISASGTNYVPSSPSPAASGGTSVFRENRMTSP